MNPYRYQLTKEEFEKEWTVKDNKPMSDATFYRRKAWAQEHYSEWRKAFLADGRVDLKEYQKFNTAYSQYKYEERLDPHVKLYKEGVY